MLTLALGIGANTAIFSVVDGAMLRPAPFRDIGRLAMVWETDRKSSTLREPASIPDYFDFQQRSRRFEQLAAFAPVSAAVAPDAGEPDRVAALAVSHEFLPMLGMQPLLGTSFAAEQDQTGADLVVMISETFWTERLNRDPAWSDGPCACSIVPPRSSAYCPARRISACSRCSARPIISGDSPTRAAMPG